MSEEKRISELETEVAVVKSNINGLSASINLIMTNHLPHIQKGVEDLGVKLDDKFDKLCRNMDDKYVSKEEFKPVKSVVYGMVGFILLAFLAAIVGAVIVTNK